MPNQQQDHIEKRSPTSRIDRLQWSISEQTIKNTISRYETICTIDTPEEIKWELNKCFPLNPQKVIRDFFMEHPVCWTDMQRKIHAFSEYDNNKNRWRIPDEKLWGIYESFLIRGRKNDIGEKIRNLLPRAISENKDLLKFSREQPSLLDEGGFMFSNIPSVKRKRLIKSLIKNWMLKNIEWCDHYKDIDIYIPKILPKILRYITEIFWKVIHIGYCKTMDDLTKELEKKFSSWHGSERENAFRVIQSFHAWSSIEEIEKIHTLAQEKISYIPKNLEKIWISIEGTPSCTDHNDDTIYSANILFQEKKYRCVWRVKTVKSILQKMWETEEYTNKDAIRDMIWVHFIWPDDTPMEDKKRLILKWWALMPNFWYILKDKWGIWEEINNVANSLWAIIKNPVYISSKLWNTSNPLINNTSISGFMSLGWESLWTEFQYSDEKWAEWKKNEDKVYKPKWMLTILMRWPKFATPYDCYELLNERIKAGTLRELGHDNINSMIMWYIENEKFLIPYISENAKELLITNISEEDEFIEKFPNMKKSSPWDTHYEKVRSYILSLI